MKNEHRMIMDIIGLLLESKTDIHLSEDNGFKEQLHALSNELERLLNSNLPNMTVIEIDRDISVNDVTIENINIEIEKHLKILNNIMDKEKIVTVDEETLNNQIVELNKDRNKIINSIIIKTDINRYKRLSDLLDYIQPDVVSILTELTEFTDVIITNEHISNTLDNLSIVKNNIDKVKNRYDTLVSDKTILENNKAKEDIHCKKCGNSWKMNYDEKTYNLVISKLDNLNKEINKLHDDEKKLEDEVALIKSKLELIKRYKNILTTDSDIELIYNYLNDNGFTISNHPNIIIDKIYMLSINLKEWYKVDKLDSTIKDTVHKLDILLKSKEVLSKVEIDNKSSVEDNLNKLYINKKECTDKKNTLIRNRKNLLTVDKLTKEIKYLLSAIKKNTNKEIIELRNKHINETIKIFRTDSTIIETNIRESEFTKKTISNIKSEVATLTQNKKVLDIMIKELSPTEGLIAKSIISFLYNFTNSVNDIINSIWTYDLRVLPCDIGESSDLNYRFPIMVDNKPNAKDVSRTSSGMREIIDLSFKIVSMNRLGISDYSLYLDEFGKSMDPEHRLKAFGITDTLANGDFSQIFMVSHFEGQYNRKKDSDVVILSDDNILLNDIAEYNKVVKIT